MTSEIEAKKRRVIELAQYLHGRDEALSLHIAQMEEIRARDAAKKAYKAIKGDIVDEMLAKYINQAGVQLPITRLGGGFYMFGTKKIYAKIMNNKLVVRVGGGFMGIDEFIHSYGESELLKLKRFTSAQIAELHRPYTNGPQQQKTHVNHHAMSPRQSETNVSRLKSPEGLKARHTMVYQTPKATSDFNM